MCSAVLSADGKAAITALFCSSCSQQLFVDVDTAFKQQIAAGMPVSPLEVLILTNWQTIFFVAASAFGFHPAVQSDQEKREFGWYSCLCLQLYTGVSGY